MGCLCGHGESCKICTSKKCYKLTKEYKVELLEEEVLSLKKQLTEALDEMNWWKKKHQEDCQEIRLVGRREGEKIMREKCRKVCLDVARSESYYSDNVVDECAQEISKIEISNKL